MENRQESRSFGSAAAAGGLGNEGTRSPNRPPSGSSPHPVTGMPRPARATNSSGPAPQAKRARKDRGPNWNAEEISALISAKRQMFLEELDAVDGRDLMNPDATKWVLISLDVIRADCSPCPRDGPACKTKWNQLISDYKKIADFFARTGTNGKVFWDLTAVERKTEGLPRSFSEEVFYGIHEWYGNRPSMNPPHMRDLLSQDDTNYNPRIVVTENMEDQFPSDPDTEDPMDLAHAAGVEETDDSSRGGVPPSSTRARVPATSETPNTPNNSPTGSPRPRHRNPVPAGVIPVVLSSSGTSQMQSRRQDGNTGVRRKTVTGHSLIADATRASGEVMASQMKNMADASLDLEKSKIEVQLKLFTEQMEFQREKDRRLHENARRANDNAKLAIEKQGDIVRCLATLAQVLSRGMHLIKGKQDGADPQTDLPQNEETDTVGPLQPATAVPSSGQPSADPTL